MGEKIAAFVAIASMGWLAWQLHPQEPQGPPPVSVRDPLPVQVVEIAAPPAETRKESFIPLDVPLDPKLQEYIARECREAVPPVSYEAVLAIIEHESGYNPDAVGYNANGTTDHGLMQINSCNHEWLSDELGITDIMDPKQNVEAGIHILSLLLEEEGDLPHALLAYQYGQAGAGSKTGSEFQNFVLERSDELEGRKFVDDSVQ